MRLAGTFKMGSRWVEGQNDPETLEYAVFTCPVCLSPSLSLSLSLSHQSALLMCCSEDQSWGLSKGLTDRRCLRSPHTCSTKETETRTHTLPLSWLGHLPAKQPRVLSAFLQQSMCKNRMRPGLVTPVGGRFRGDLAVRPEVAQSLLGLSTHFYLQYFCLFHHISHLIYYKQVTNILTIHIWHILWILPESHKLTHCIYLTHPLSFASNIS